jgi:hypothetical protein
LGQVATQIPEAKNAFETTWLTTGAMFVLLFDRIHSIYLAGNWKRLGANIGGPGVRDVCAFVFIVEIPFGRSS